MKNKTLSFTLSLLLVLASTGSTHAQPAPNTGTQPDAIGANEEIVKQYEVVKNGHTVTVTVTREAETPTADGGNNPNEVRTNTCRSRYTSRGRFSVMLSVSYSYIPGATILSATYSQSHSEQNGWRLTSWQTWGFIYRGTDSAESGADASFKAPWGETDQFALGAIEGNYWGECYTVWG